MFSPSRRHIFCLLATAYISLRNSWAVRAVQPGKRPARRAWRKAQYEVLLPLLWGGECALVLKYLQSLRQATGEVPPALEEAIRYLETQQDRLGNYEQWQAQGYPVGRGLVERAVAIVINLRMKNAVCDGNEPLGLLKSRR